MTTHHYISPKIPYYKKYDKNIYFTFSRSNSPPTPISNSHTDSSPEKSENSPNPESSENSDNSPKPENSDNSHINEKLLIENMNLKLKLKKSNEKCRKYESKLKSIYNYQRKINKLQNKMFSEKISYVKQPKHNNINFNRNSYDGNSLRFKHLKLPQINHR